jgi:hypothetical protein
MSISGSVYVLLGGVDYEGESIIEIFDNPLQAEMRKIEYEMNKDELFYDYLKIEPFMVTTGVKSL